MSELSIQDAFPTEVQEHHMGIIQVSASVLDALGITIQQTDTQGQLCNSGVFTLIHQRLLLPASYHVIAAFFAFSQRIWHIWVESPDVPAVTEYACIPYIRSSYTRTHRHDGTTYTQLVEITSGEWTQDYRAEQLVAQWQGERG